MKKEAFCKTSGDIDEKHADESRAYEKSKRQSRIKRVAAAACICFIVGAAIPMLSRDADSGSAPIAGGDTGNYSVAVFPAGERPEDVKDAVCISVSEEDARGIEMLGKYIPHSLPDGVHFGRGSYYMTTMNDGTLYQMIRVTYECAQAPITHEEDKNAQSSHDNMGSTALYWTVWGHRPDTEFPFYSVDELSVSLIDKQDSGVFYIELDSVYIGIEQLDITSAELYELIKSVM